MNKNIKRMFFVLTLVTLLATVGTVCATDDANSTIAVDSSVSDVATVSDAASDTLVAESVKTTSDDNKVDTKTIDKNLKTSTKTVEVNNYNELTKTINTAVQDADNEEYVINLNAGTYQITANTILNAGTYMPNITINANNQTLRCNPNTRYTRFNNGCNITINNAIITQRIQNYANNITIYNSTINNIVTNIQNMNLHLVNSYINTTITNNGILTISEDVILGEKFAISGSGNIISNRSDLTQYISVYNGTYTLEDIIISSQKTNYGNLTIRNSTINNTISNYGNLTISEDVILGEKFAISGSGNIISNRSDLTQYISVYNGTYTLEDIIISSQKTNYGNLTIRNSTINNTISNYGNLTLSNSTINYTISNYGNLTINEDVIFTENFILDNTGILILNDTSRLIPHLRYYNGTYSLENMTINKQKINYGNLTLNNCTVIYPLPNYGNIIIIDSEYNCVFDNYGNATVINSKNYRINNYNPNANITIINSTLGNELVFGIMNYQGCFANISNSIINGSVSNNGELLLNNVTINNNIHNSMGSKLVIDDNTLFSQGIRISNEGEIVINDTSRIAPYLDAYDGNYVLKDVNIISGKRNTGNLSIINCTLNTSITNSGILIISDDTVIGENAKINGAGKVIINDTSRILPYLNGYNDNYTINNTILTGSKTNYAYLTINNTEINATLTNGGELYIYNSIINKSINNQGLLEIYNSTLNSSIFTSDDLIIGDNCIFGENLIISGDGEVIINDTDRIVPYLQTLNGNYTIENITITDSRINNGNLTFINSTLNATITNNGNLIIADDVILGENLEINGAGKIITNDTNKIFPYLNSYNGNYTIENTNILTSKSNYGNLIINNCNITNSITNEGNLIFNNCYIGAMINQIINNNGNVTFNNCTIYMTKYPTGAIPTWLTNTGNATIREDTVVIEGKLNNRGNITYTELPKPKTYIVTNDTLHEYFQDDVDGKLTDIVNPGDTLDFQGTITRNHSLTINKPINIISTTQDAYVDLDTHAGSLMGESPGASFAINKEGSYTNVTDIYFHNTQLWLYNTHHVTLDNISAVVENQRVGSGVGQTSIRANSTYCTVKNSFIYTKNNGGSSSLVLAWGDYCTLINNTIQGEGQVGNLVYLTTWNVEIPEGIIANQHNQIINNTILGPSTSAAICYAIALGGPNNLVEGNIINYTGSGITVQFGGESQGMTETTLFALGSNIINNNKLYGCGIDAGDVITNNYIQDGTLNVNDNKIITNNTVYDMTITGDNSTVTDNTINNQLTLYQSIGPNTIIENNTAKIVAIPKQTNNITLKNNNITGQININGTNCTITNNNIITDNEYTITGRGKNNTITDNYLISVNKVGDKTVSLDKNTNTIANNTPYETTLQVDTTTFTIGEKNNITATIYYGENILTNINKGKVTFKVDGKTLKDENGKVIYAKVVNGIATIENYIVPDNWNNSTTIQAVYSGSTECEKLTTEKTNITILADEPTLTTEDITTTTGGKITLKATITDNNKVINTGKIVFKINGKTVKDENGKVIYAKVVNNTVEFEYTLPESYKTGMYNITATFISPDYDRLTNSKTLTVN